MKPRFFITPTKSEGTIAAATLDVAAPDSVVAKTIIQVGGQELEWSNDLFFYRTDPSDQHAIGASQVRVLCAPRGLHWPYLRQAVAYAFSNPGNSDPWGIAYMQIRADIIEREASFLILTPAVTKTYCRGHFEKELVIPRRAVFLRANSSHLAPISKALVDSIVSSNDLSRVKQFCHRELRLDSAFDEHIASVWKDLSPSDAAQVLMYFVYRQVIHDTLWGPNMTWASLFTSGFPANALVHCDSKRALWRPEAYAQYRFVADSAVAFLKARLTYLGRISDTPRSVNPMSVGELTVHCKSQRIPANATGAVTIGKRRVALAQSASVYSIAVGSVVTAEGRQVGRVISPEVARLNHSREPFPERLRGLDWILLD